MRIRLIWAGRTKERFLAEGIKAYAGKIRPFAQLELVEVKEPRGGPIEAMLRKEGEAILKKVSGPYTLFDERGERLDSMSFASRLGARARTEFVLGGAYGVSDEVRQGAEEVISLSPMTFTHEMARLVALEQIYRALMINSGRGYHH